MTKESKNLVVVQSNKLVEAHYKQEYTVQEQRTILWIISKIHKNDFVHHENNTLKEISISASDYANIMNISPKDVYRDAQKIGEKLMEKVLAIKEDNSWLLVHWVSSMKYENGIITAKVHPDLIPYLIDLKEKFTSFKLENILYLNSSYAIKIYQLLAQYKTSGERELTLDDLRSMLGISEKKTYQNYGSFKQKILERAKKEINAKTDISFSCKEKKQNRKVIAIQFKITPKSQENKINLDKKIALQKEAVICFNRNNGSCAASWENYKTNIEKACYYCRKFITLRTQNNNNET